MWKSKAFLIAYLVILLIVSFSLLNFIIYLKVRDLVQEALYAKAFVFYLTKGIEYANIFVFLNEKAQGYKVYTFISPNPPFLIYVGVPKSYVDSILNRLFLSIIFLEFLLTLLFATIYLGVIENFTKKIEQQNRTIKDLILSIMHKAGNFISVQKLNLSLIQRKLPNSPILHRMEKSLLGFQRDINLIANLLEDKETKREWLNLKVLIEEIIKDVIQDYSNKRVIQNLKNAYVYADPLDMESIVYNLISNAFKHSISFVHIKMCVKDGKVLLIVRNDIGKGSGTGLGLKLLQRAVKRQKGEMSIRVKNKFNVYLIFSLF